MFQLSTRKLGGLGPGEHARTERLPRVRRRRQQLRARPRHRHREDTSPTVVRRPQRPPRTQRLPIAIKDHLELAPRTDDKSRFKAAIGKGGGGMRGRREG